MPSFLALDWALFLDLIANGLVIGVGYVLMAMGVSLIFGIFKIVNFAHGEFYMAGTYVYTYLAVSMGIPLWVALGGAIVTGGVIGWFVERLLMRPLYLDYASWGGMNARHEYGVIVTFGLSLLLVNAADKIFGPYSFFGPEMVSVKRVFIGPVVLSGHRIFACVLGVIVILAMVLFLRHTYWGKQVQAVSQNRLGAALGGEDPIWVSKIVFVTAGALAALAGALLSPIVLADPLVGLFPAIKSLVVVVLGGMGSMLGAIVGGLLVGVAEMFAAVYLSNDYRDVFGLVILVVVLLVRPHGLFGEKARDV
jgi:branched-chain amino acid transport system permease protein